LDEYCNFNERIECFNSSQGFPIPFFQEKVMRLNRLFGILVLAGCACGAFAQAPATTPEGANYFLSPVKTASLASTTIMYQSLQLSAKDSADPKNISDFMGGNVHRMFMELEAAHIATKGGAIFIYPHAPAQDGSMDLEIGIPVAEKTSALEGYQVKVLESTPTGSAVYRGTFHGVGQALPEFFRQLQQSGKVPAGELRERILFYDGDASANNVTLIEIPVSE
jgi:effector-binding domain-containing protein